MELAQSFNTLVLFSIGLKVAGKCVNFAATLLRSMTSMVDSQLSYSYKVSLMKFSLAPLILWLAAAPVQSLMSPWDRVCPARQSFFEQNLKTENYVSPQELIQEYVSTSAVDLIILGEAHYQPSLVKTLEYLRLISQNPAYNCLFVEATRQSWQEDIEFTRGYRPDHPLYFIKEFYDQVSELPMELRFVDQRNRFEAWMRSHSFPMTDEDLLQTAYEEITYRNLVMSTRIADAMTKDCKKGVLLIGVSHLSSYSRGFPVSGIKGLLTSKGINSRAIYLLDSELFVGVDETLNDSIPSPSLCFSACPNNPDLPATEVAFQHRYPEGISKADLALVDAGKIDAHYGAPTMGHWSDFDATIIFPPRFVNSCTDSRMH